MYSNGYYQDSGVRIDARVLRELLDTCKDDAVVLIRMPVDPVPGKFYHLCNHMSSLGGGELLLFTESDPMVPKKSR